jgi:hypothetical protein
MSFGVLAYPKISRVDLTFIQDFRKENDELYFDLVLPHFAFVFPMDSVEKTQFLKETTAKATGFKAIQFEIKCTTVNKDSFLDYYHLLLVPDQGYSDVLKLHDCLYSDLFFDELRLDIDFIPHIGIANSKDPYRVKKWADDWNRKDFSISGVINKLTVIEYDGKTLNDIKDIELY